MTPFLLAAIASALSSALFTTLRRTNPYKYVAIMIEITILLCIVALGVYYIRVVHGQDIDNYYFLDGPLFRQLALGIAFGFVYYYLLMYIVSNMQENDKEINCISNSQPRKRPPSQETVPKFKAGIEYIVSIFALLVMLLFGAFQENVISTLAQLGGNLRLGGVEFGFGRNESRSGETSVSQLVPPATSTSYAPPSVSLGLQSLADLGEAMRRDALIYALRKGLVDGSQSCEDGVPTKRLFENG